MNCTSARECGGNVALVEDGSFRVGWPGAPGWTTTGDSACCAETQTDNKHARVHTATLILHLALKYFMSLNR